MSFNVMLAKGYEPRRIIDWNSIYVEPKLDGVRVLAFVGRETVTYRSRNGNILEMFSHLNKPLRADGDKMRKLWRYEETVVFDGEMMGTDFSDVSGAIHRKNATVKSMIFNPFMVMPAKAFKLGVDEAPQMTRLKQMHEAGLVIPVARKAICDEDVQKIYTNLLKSGYEGAMVKDYSRPWMATRSHTWMKLKEELTLDLPIVDFREGKGKFVGTLGSMLVDYKGRLVPVYGFTDKFRDHVWANRPKFKGQIVEVLFQRPTVHGSLRHARFKRMRSDK